MRTEFCVTLEELERAYASKKIHRDSLEVKIVCWRHRAILCSKCDVIVVKGKLLCWECFSGDLNKERLRNHMPLLKEEEIRQELESFPKHYGADQDLYRYPRST